MSRYWIAALGLASVLVVGLAVADPPSGPVAGHIQTIGHLRTPDGGLVRAAGTASGASVVSLEAGGAVALTGAYLDADAGTVRVRERGYPSGAGAADCVEVTCYPAGDGGTLTAVTGQRYYSTVTTASAVRVANGVACNAFVGGVGRILNEGSIVDFIALANADGGAPIYSCCSLGTTSATAPITWQLCKQAQ